MRLTFFLYIAVIFSLILGEFGQFPFGQTQFSISITDILLVLSLSALLVWKIAIKKDLSLPQNFWWLAGFWGVGFLSLAASLDFSGGFYLLRFIVYSGIFYLVFQLAKSKALGLKEFTSLVVLAGLGLALLGFLQLMFFPDLEVLSSYGYDPHKYRLFSTFLDPNFAGAFISFGLLLSLSRLLDSKKSKSEFLTILILFTGLILTFSRSAYLMFFAATLILLLFKKRPLIIPLFLIPLVLYLAFPPFSERLNGAVTLDKSASERFYSWDKGLKLFSQNPILGVGFNNTRQASQKLDLVKTYSSDGGNSGSGVDWSLLFVLVTTGIPGIILFGGFLVRILKNFFQKKSAFSLTLFSIMVGLLLNSFFINSLFFPALMVLWFSAAGLFYGLGDGEAS